MTADEMLIELGYEKTIESDIRIMYERGGENGEEKRIYFSLNRKHFYKIDGFAETGVINMDELKAIEQKCRELGWLNDTADDMLKFIGYDKIEENEKLITYELGIEKIYFDKFNRTVRKTEFESNPNFYEAGTFNNEELKAINKIFEELGWNDR